MYTEEQRLAAKAWLETIDSHGIFDHDLAAADYLKTVGVVAPWPKHSPTSVIAAIKRRGLGGEYSNPDQRPSCYGYEMAEAIAKAAVDPHVFQAVRQYHGRGSQFRAYAEVL